MIGLEDSIFLTVVANDILLPSSCHSVIALDTKIGHHEIAKKCIDTTTATENEWVISGSSLINIFNGG